jgi:hypothetical protein
MNSIPSRHDAVFHATELVREAQLALEAVKAANLIERVGVMEKELAELRKEIREMRK